MRSSVGSAGFDGSQQKDFSNRALRAEPQTPPAPRETRPNVTGKQKEAKPPSLVEDHLGPARVLVGRELLRARRGHGAEELPELVDDVRHPELDGQHEEVERVGRVDGEEHEHVERLEEAEREVDRRLAVVELARAEVAVALNEFIGPLRLAITVAVTPKVADFSRSFQVCENLSAPGGWSSSAFVVPSQGVLAVLTH